MITMRIRSTLSIGVLFLSLWFSDSVFSQVPLSLGTTWEYNSTYFLGDSSVTSSTIVGDTVLSGKNCFILEREIIHCNQRGQREYIYQEEDKMFFYNFDSEEFSMLYDFGAEIGDTIMIKPWAPWDTKANYFLFKVDSISMITIGSTELKNFTMTTGLQNDAGEESFGDFQIDVTEGIGARTNLFYWTGSGFCDALFVNRLICYTNPILGQFSSAGEGCLTSGVKNISTKVPSNIFPNPALDQITIRTDSDYIQVYDLNGRVIMERAFDGMPIDISDWRSGLYLLRTETEVLRFVKR